MNSLLLASKLCSLLCLDAMQGHEFTFSAVHLCTVSVHRRQSAHVWAEPSMGLVNAGVGHG